jgi:hypothetical protein
MKRNLRKDLTLSRRVDIIVVENELRLRDSPSKNVLRRMGTLRTPNGEAIVEEGD